MCQTIEGTVPDQAESFKLEKTQSTDAAEDSSKPKELCPQDCPCRATKPSTRLQILFTAMGILFAIFATYLMITTDSNLYLIFWICYSVLRRMMGKARGLKMKKD